MEQTPCIEFRLYHDVTLVSVVEALSKTKLSDTTKRFFEDSAYHYIILPTIAARFKRYTKIKKLPCKGEVNHIEKEPE